MGDFAIGLTIAIGVRVAICGGGGNRSLDPESNAEHAESASKPKLANRRAIRRDPLPIPNAPSTIRARDPHENADSFGSIGKPGKWAEPAYGRI
jgi:hypothetical protein